MSELAIVLSGGGARGAYQVGFLRGLAQRYPRLDIDILVGISAGAINAAYLAGHAGDTFYEKVEGLRKLWWDLEVDQVFRVDVPSLMGKVIGAGVRLVSGGDGKPIRGMVDTEPLRELIEGALGAAEGTIPGVAENLASGALKALAVAATSYSTGQTVTFVQGRAPTGPVRPNRVNVSCDLTVAHVMASAAIPLFFPAVLLDGLWYGDGQIRNSTPLSPAVHLGASRVIALSTRYPRSQREAARSISHGYPPPAQIVGVLMNAMFLDFFDLDAVRLERINELIADRATGRDGLRPITFMLQRPSQDLGRLANEYEARLPKAFRYLTRSLGTRRMRSNDALSTVMFQSDYTQRLIQLGESDFETRREEMDRFLEVSGLAQPEAPRA